MFPDNAATGFAQLDLPTSCVSLIELARYTRREEQHHAENLPLPWNSRFSRHLGVRGTVRAHEIVPVNFATQFRATPEWRALNPVGKVPVMVDGDMTMFESCAMMQYVLDHYGDGRLQPKFIARTI